MLGGHKRGGAARRVTAAAHPRSPQVLLDYPLVAGVEDDVEDLVVLVVFFVCVGNEFEMIMKRACEQHTPPPSLACRNSSTTRSAVMRIDTAWRFLVSV